jgi:hypothetical protein
VRAARAARAVRAVNPKSGFWKTFTSSEHFQVSVATLVRSRARGPVGGRPNAHRWKAFTPCERFPDFKLAGCRSAGLQPGNQAAVGAGFSENVHSGCTQGRAFLRHLPREPLGNTGFLENVHFEGTLSRHTHSRHFRQRASRDAQRAQEEPPS